MNFPDLFQNIDQVNDSLWIVKEYFNNNNDDYFLDMISNLMDRVGWGNEYAGCDFPENMDYEEELFEGVKCWYFEEEVIVSENYFKKCLIIACKEYVKLNPDKKQETEKIINQSLS